MLPTHPRGTLDLPEHVALEMKDQRCTAAGNFHLVFDLLGANGSITGITSRPYAMASGDLVREKYRQPPLIDQPADAGVRSDASTFGSHTETSAQRIQGGRLCRFFRVYACVATLRISAAALPVIYW
jgi:hypothetical protein